MYILKTILILLIKNNKFYSIPTPPSYLYIYLIILITIKKNKYLRYCVLICDKYKKNKRSY